jgi:inner membrane protein
MNRKLALKLLVIGLVMGVILIALAMVNGTITDRQKYRDDVWTRRATLRCGR